MLVTFMMSSDKTQPIQRLNNRYLIDRLIGRGGMGNVYVAQDLQTRTSVAIKQLRPELIQADPLMPERFAHEGRLLRELDHPNIVKVLDTFTAGTEHYLVLEYLAGGSLRDILDQRKQLPLDRVIAIALELSDALTRAHHLGIVHRDIKPANILIAPDGTPRLTDFGTAVRVSQLDEDSQTGTITGTYAYLSPEACQGQLVDGRADIWSQGVLLFEMLTGELPFPGRLPGQVITAILNAPPADLLALRPDTPRPLVDLITRMLHKNPADRPASSRVIAAELEAILTGRASTASIKATQTIGRSTFKHNLPVPTTPFIGRESELQEAHETLAKPNCRLLTVLAPGGMGKTRFGLEIAHQYLSQFADGVFFVPLASLTSPEFIPTMLAEQVGFSAAAGSSPGTSREIKEQLLNYLTNKQMLLVLDNFEHLLAGAALVQEILTHAHQVRVLVTSRERLNLSSEWLLRISGLDAPPAGAEAHTIAQATAVRLFAQSASRLNHDFHLEQLNPADLENIAHICRLVEGMPLGIELASTWVEMLTLSEIVTEIEQGLDILETQNQDMPARHRSMRAVFDYSWQILTPAEQSSLAKLSVFRGGFTRQAAAEIAKATLPLLSNLVNKSLLRQFKVTEENQQISIRYEVHELLRQFSAEKLADRPEVAHETFAKHAQFYTHFLDQFKSYFYHDNRKEYFSAVEREIKNVYSAWQWAVLHEEEAIIQALALNLANFHLARNWLKPGRALFQEAYKKFPAAGTPTQQQLHYTLLAIYISFSPTDLSFEQQEQLLKKALTFAQTQNSLPYVAYMETVLAGLYGQYAHLEQSQTHWQAALTLFEQLGRYTQMANAHLWLGRINREQGAYEQGKEHFYQSLELFKREESSLGIAEVSLELNIIAYRQMKADEAEKFAQEALQMYRLVGDGYGIAQSIRALGIAAGIRHEYDRAEAYYLEALALHRQLGNQLWQAAMLNNLAYTKISQQQYEQAKEYGLEGLAIAQAIQNHWSTMYILENLSWAYIDLQDYPNACLYLKQALELGQTMEAWPLVLGCVVGIGYILTAEGRYSEALAILEPVTHDQRLMADLNGRLAEAHQRCLAQLPPAEAAEAQAQFTSLPELMAYCGTLLH